MQKTVLEEIKKLNKDIDEISKKHEVNEKKLDKLKENELVSEALKIALENIGILNNIRVYRNNINNLILNKCNHNLLYYKDYSICMYDSYYTYKCLECGEIIDSTIKLNNTIKSNISYDEIRKEYFNYLFKYDEVIALNLILAKYNNEFFSELIENGLDEIKALKLINNRKDY